MTKPYTALLVDFLKTKNINVTADEINRLAADGTPCCIYVDESTSIFITIKPEDLVTLFTFTADLGILAPAVTNDVIKNALLLNNFNYQHKAKFFIDGENNKLVLFADLPLWKADVFEFGRLFNELSVINKKFRFENNITYGMHENTAGTPSSKVSSV